MTVHLIHQAPESTTRGAWRGSGFELRTDGWLAVRAGEGLLISATARANSQGTQMDVAETLGQLKAAAETAKALSDAAQGQTALPLKANAAQADFIRAIDPQQEGRYRASLSRCSHVRQIFDPWFMDANSRDQEIATPNEQRSDNEKLHATHLHITVDEPKLIKKS